MRTTLTIDDDVAAVLERLCRAQNKSFKQLVNEALRRGLNERRGPSRSRKPFKTRSVDVGRCLIGSLDDISEVLSVAEGDDRH